MKILITGGTGFIGRHLVAFWKGSSHQIAVLARHIDVSLFDESIGCLETDITVKEDVQAAIIFLQPDVVIHTAATSKPNDCELNKEQAYLTNVTATQYIIEACKAVGAKLVFLSTDFVFGHDGPYTEEDHYAPVNYYGETKVLAEKAVKESGLNYAIVRTVLVVGKQLPGSAGTFLHWVKSSLAAGRTIQVYTDQQRCVTDVNDLCSGINTIIEKDMQGVWHLSGDEVYTPFALAQAVANYFNYDLKLIQSVTSQERPEPAMRPRNSVIKIDKAKEQLGYQTRALQTIMAEVFE